MNNQFNFDKFLVIKKLLAKLHIFSKFYGVIEIFFKTFLI